MNAVAGLRMPGNIPWEEASAKIEKIRNALRAVAVGNDPEKVLEPLIETCLFWVEDMCDQLTAADGRQFKELISEAVAANMTLIAHHKHREEKGSVASGVAAIQDDSALGEFWKGAYNKTNDLRDRLRERSGGEGARAHVPDSDMAG